jgi:hypothetical protein
MIFLKVDKGKAIGICIIMEISCMKWVRVNLVDQDFGMYDGFSLESGAGKVTSGEKERGQAAWGVKNPQNKDARTSIVELISW